MKCLGLVVLVIALWVISVAIGGVILQALWDVVRWVWLEFFHVSLPDTTYPYFCLISLLLGFLTMTFSKGND